MILKLLQRWLRDVTVTIWVLAWWDGRLPHARLYTRADAAASARHAVESDGSVVLLTTFNVHVGELLRQAADQ